MIEDINKLKNFILNANFIELAVFSFVCFAILFVFWMLQIYNPLTYLFNPMDELLDKIERRKKVMEYIGIAIFTPIFGPFLLARNLIEKQRIKKQRQKNKEELDIFEQTMDNEEDYLCKESSNFDKDNYELCDYKSRLYNWKLFKKTSTTANIMNIANIALGQLNMEKRMKGRIDYLKKLKDRIYDDWDCTLSEIPYKKLSNINSIIYKMKEILEKREFFYDKYDIILKELQLFPTYDPTLLNAVYDNKDGNIPVHLSIEGVNYEQK